MSAEFRGGELRLYAGGSPVLGSIFLDNDIGAVAKAYWRWLLLSREPREASSFASELRRPPAEAQTPAARQFMARVDRLEAQTTAIGAAERNMNESLFELYDLSADERLLVERAGAWVEKVPRGARFQPVPVAKMKT